MGEAVYDSGIGIVGIHPDWDEQKMKENRTVLGNDRRLPPTFPEAVETLEVEMPVIARIIKKRDAFAANHLLPRADDVAFAIPELRQVDRIPSLIEIGSLHFGLADRLANRGFTVETSGEQPDAVAGAQEQGLIHLLRGGTTDDLDLERIAFEDALHCAIRAKNSQIAQAAVDSIVVSKPDRSTWPDYYAAIAADFRQDS